MSRLTILPKATGTLSAKPPSPLASAAELERSNRKLPDKQQVLLRACLGATGPEHPIKALIQFLVFPIR